MKPLLIQTLRTTLTASVVLMLAACPSHTSDKSDAKPHTRTANTAKPKAVVAAAAHPKVLPISALSKS